MKKAIHFAVLVFGLVLVFAISASAQKSVEGDWDAEFNTPGGARPFKLFLKVDGEKLTGTVKRSSGDAAVTGTIKGNDIAFSYSISYNGNALTLNYTGKVNGDTMGGTVAFNENASDTWTAKRAAAKQ